MNSYLAVFVAVALLMILASILAVVLDRRYAPKPAVPPPVDPPVEVPVPPPIPDVTPVRPRIEAVPIRLIDQRGRFLGTIKIDRRMRRPTLLYRPHPSRPACTFVAEKHDGDGFIYRMVGRERE